MRFAVPSALALLLCLILSSTARSEHIQQEIVEVPIDRIITNLEKDAEADPKSAATRHALARLHAMAYALRADTMKVRKRDQEKGPAWFGYEPKNMPFQATPSQDPEKEQKAFEHLEKAIKLYAQTVELEPANALARLGHGWVLDQAGQKEKAIAEYRQAVAEAWKTEGEKKYAGLGPAFIVQEAAGYLIPLLDPEKDANEIADVQVKVQQLEALPRRITPIVIPLRPGVGPDDLVKKDTHVRFDLDGTGRALEWSWITSDGAWLVFDPRGEGTITSGTRMFGNVSFWLFWDDGYRALAALDDDRNGRLEGAELAGLALWRDADSDGVSDPGEVRPLAAWGIASLGCRGRVGPAGVPECADGVRWADGRTAPTWDLILSGNPGKVDGGR